jgi:hypothetical protein
LAKPKNRRAKRKGCLSVILTNEFLPACLPAEGGQWSKERFRNSALAEYQNRKIFVSLTPVRNLKEIHHWGKGIKI